MKKVGKKFIFKCSEVGNTLNIYNGLKCTVLSKLGDYNFNDEEDSVYDIEFEDGTKIDAFTEELTEI